jgi:hypothetical protein
MLNASANFSRDDEINKRKTDMFLDELKHKIEENTSLSFKILYIGHFGSKERAMIRDFLEEASPKNNDLKDNYLVKEITSESSEEKIEENYAILTYFNNIGSLIYESDTLRQIRKKFPNYDIRV